jgi:hypothetical protein
MFVPSLSWQNDHSYRTVKTDKKYCFLTWQGWQRAVLPRHANGQRLKGRATVGLIERERVDGTHTVT